MSKPTIFVIDDSSENKAQLESILEPYYDLVFVPATPEALPSFLKIQMRVRIILIYLKDASVESLKLFRSIKTASPFPEILGYSGEENIHLAVTAMKEGAFSYFSKPFSKISLLRLIEEALNQIDIKERLEVYHNKSRFGKEDEALLKTIQDQHKLKIQKKENKEKPTVLIVEDEPIYRKAITSFLETDYTVLFSETRANAQKIIESHPEIQLVLLDVFLPDGSGLDIITDIRKVNTGAQIVMVTAFEFVDIAVESIRKGACDYLNKPFLKDQLLAVVEKAMKRYYDLEILPKAIDAFIKDPLSYPQKIEWINTLFENRKEAKQAVYMEDLYKVFPELEQTYIPGSVPLPSQVLENKGLEGFIKELHSNSVME